MPCPVRRRLYSSNPTIKSVEDCCPCESRECPPEVTSSFVLPVSGPQRPPAKSTSSPNKQLPGRTNQRPHGEPYALPTGPVQCLQLSAMDFQDAVFKALEEQKREQQRADGGKPHLEDRGAPQNGLDGAANGHTDGVSKASTETSQGTPVRGVEDGAAPATTNSTTAAAPATTNGTSTTDGAGADGPPRLQMPINLGYMFPPPARSRPTSRSPSGSRSPTYRGGADQADYSYVLPPISSHHLPPSSPTAADASSMQALGLDTPRPKTRSQASYAWFDDSGRNSPGSRSGPHEASPARNANEGTKSQRKGSGEGGGSDGGERQDPSVIPQQHVSSSTNTRYPSRPDQDVFADTSG